MIDPVFEQMVTENMMKTKFPQMTRDEYHYVGNFLGGKNFLVFGTGYDTPLWRHGNVNGKTFFLESDPRWIRQEDKDVIKVNYTTMRSQQKELLEEYHNNNFARLQMDLPAIIRETKWDCIFVDAPMGMSDKPQVPGRMQSIFEASVLADEDTDVFVHDCDRHVENVYSKTMFSRVIKDLTKLRHVKL